MANLAPIGLPPGGAFFAPSAPDRDYSTSVITLPNGMQIPIGALGPAAQALIADSRPRAGRGPRVVPIGEHLQEQIIEPAMSVLPDKENFAYPEALRESAEFARGQTAADRAVSGLDKEKAARKLSAFGDSVVDYLQRPGGGNIRSAMSLGGGEPTPNGSPSIRMAMPPSAIPADPAGMVEPEMVETTVTAEAELPNMDIIDQWVNTQSIDMAMPPRVDVSSDIGMTPDVPVRMQSDIGMVPPGMGPRQAPPAPKKTSVLAPGDRKVTQASPARPAGRSGGAFDPQGSDYDYETARANGMGPGGTGEDAGHWGSVAPVSREEMSRLGLPDGSYVILKGRNHETWDKAVAAEKARGADIVERNGRFYSVPRTADDSFAYTTSERTPQAAASGAPTGRLTADQMFEKAMSYARGTPEDKAKLEKEKFNDRSMGLLMAGLGTMGAASKPGGTAFGSLAEGAAGGLNYYRGERKDRAAKELAGRKMRMDAGKMYIDLVGKEADLLQRIESGNLDREQKAEAARELRALQRQNNQDNNARALEVARMTASVNGVGKDPAELKLIDGYVERGIAPDKATAAAMIQFAKSDPVAAVNAWAKMAFEADKEAVQMGQKKSTRPLEEYRKEAESQVMATRRAFGMSGVGGAPPPASVPGAPVLRYNPATKRFDPVK